MLNWHDPKARQPWMVSPRPILYIEDNISDVFKFVKALADRQLAGELLEACTVMLLAAPGGDTTRDIIELLVRFPGLQLMALPDEPRLAPALRASCEALRTKSSLPPGEVAEALAENARRFEQGSPNDAVRRYGDLERVILREEHAFIVTVDRLIRPGGMVVCDLDLGQLEFNRTEELSANLLIGAIAAGKACQGDELAETEKVKQQRPALSVFSQMEKFLSVGATLRRRKIKINDDAVFLKNSELHFAAEAISELVGARFPWRMTIKPAATVSMPRPAAEMHRVGREDIPFLEQNLDLILWPCIANGRASGQGIVEGGWTYADVPAEALRKLVAGHLKPQRSAVLNTDIRTDGQRPPNVIMNIRQRMRDELIPGGSQGQYQLNTAKSVAMVSDVTSPH